MNALELLRSDHRRISELIQEVENELNAQTGQASAESFKRLARALNSHRRMLREYLYPELEPFNQTAGYLSIDSTNETQLHGLVTEIEQNHPVEQGWTIRLARIAELWQTHVEQSERQLFPLAQRLLGPIRLEQLQYGMDAVRSHQSHMNSAIYPAARLGPKT